MEIKVKRIYEKPLKKDGLRVLVDRLWPRGISKEKAKIDLWLKEAAPSEDLRKWFHLNKEENFKVFENKYKKELQENRLTIEESIGSMKYKIVLITAVKDINYSHIPTLISFLKKINK